MKRAWSGPSTARRRTIPLTIVATVVVVIVAACSSTTETPTSPSPPTTLIEPTDAASVPADSAEPPSPSESSVSPSSSGPAATSTPIPSPTTAHGPDAAAAACFGSADTRDFFVAIAEAVSWPVYCAVLPTGWSVEKGSYRLANNGQMVISYKFASGGGRLELREGHWCTDSATACSPHDRDIGPGQFGDRSGELMSLDGGGYAVYVDPGKNPSWTATGTGIDQATFSQLTAALSLVSS